MSDAVAVLDAQVRTAAGAFGVEAAVRAGAGELVVVVGPNGAGKTTLLRTLAGLHPMLAGRVHVAGRDVTALVGHPRRVGYVPQSAALFPHLSVLGNVAFGVRGGPRRRRRAVASAWLDRIGAQEWAHRRPSGLSGGQVARVALARALAAEPAVLLLDEPLAAVDAAARPGLRRLLREHASGFAGTTVLVTHDPVDALVLADRLVVLEDGRVVQDAPPQQLVRAPRSVWAARLLGLNAYRGRLDGEAVHVDGGGVLHVAAGGAGPGEPAGAALAVVAPSAVALHRQRPRGSPRNVWPGVVAELAGLGGRVRVGVEAAPPVVAEVTPAAAAELALREGDEVWVSVKATEVSVTRV